MINLGPMACEQCGIMFTPHQRASFRKFCSKACCAIKWRDYERDRKAKQRLEGPLAPPHSVRGFSNSVIRSKWGREFLDHLDTEIPRRPAFPTKTILDAVTKATGFDRDAILGRSRDPRHVAVRHITIYKLKKTGNLSYSQIAKTFAREHTTCVHSVQTCRRAGL